MGWGTDSNNDRVWEAIRVNVTNPGGVFAAFNAIMDSKSAEAFPGEVWLSAIRCGNAADGDVLTHAITVATNQWPKCKHGIIKFERLRLGQILAQHYKAICEQ